MKDFSAFTISLEQAKEWTEKWRKQNPHQSKGFLMPIEDLLGCLIEMGIIKVDSDGNGTVTYKEYEKVRTYLGINSKGEEKLMMVGTKKEDGTYTDIIKDDSNTKEKAPGDSGIYNYTEPCPPECDPKSPLN